LDFFLFRLASSSRFFRKNLQKHQPAIKEVRQSTPVGINISDLLIRVVQALNLIWA
jgi:hypothetical protein